MVCKEAGRPIPPLSDDDVLDFMVVEALTFKMLEKRQEAQREADRKQRLKSHRGLRGLKPGDPLPEGF